MLAERRQSSVLVLQRTIQDYWFVGIIDMRQEFTRWKSTDADAEKKYPVAKVHTFRYDYTI